MGSARSLVPHCSFYDARRKISLINSRFPFEETFPSLVSLERETTIAWMEKARKAGGLVRGNRGTGELAVYSIIVIYFSNTNSSERRLLSGFRNRSHTRVGEREREREIRERVESLDSLAFCFPSTRSTRVYTRPNETDKVR